MLKQTLALVLVVSLFLVVGNSIYSQENCSPECHDKQHGSMS